PASIAVDLDIRHLRLTVCREVHDHHRADIDAISVVDPPLEGDTRPVGRPADVTLGDDIGRRRLERAYPFQTGAVSVDDPRTAEVVVDVVVEVERERDLAAVRGPLRAGEVRAWDRGGLVGDDRDRFV